jgi:hypothetical protein
MTYQLGLVLPELVALAAPEEGALAVVAVGVRLALAHRSV